MSVGWNLPQVTCAVQGMVYGMVYVHSHACTCNHTGTNAKARMPVLPNLCFFARREDYLRLIGLSQGAKRASGAWAGRRRPFLTGTHTAKAEKLIADSLQRSRAVLQDGHTMFGLVAQAFVPVWFCSTDILAS